MADAIHPWGNGNHVLPLGQVPPNPSELLGSRSMARLLEQLASQCDVVLIDTPALLPVTDAAILATITGGALVVAVPVSGTEADDPLALAAAGVDPEMEVRASRARGRVDESEDGWRATPYRR